MGSALTAVRRAMELSLFLATFAGVCCGQDDNRLQAGFARLDVDGDGRLSFREAGASRLGARLESADVDGDQALSFDEFRRYLFQMSAGQASRGSRRAPDRVTREPGTGAGTAGSPKRLPDGDATRDAAGLGRWFRAIHVPGFTDFREGLNGFALADIDGNGYLDLVTVTTEPYALDKSWADQTGDVQRTRDPRDRLRILLNSGGFRWRELQATLVGSPATPDDFSQGWRGGQVPVLADFNGDGHRDLFVTRQAPMRGGRLRDGYTPVGCSLFVSEGRADRLRDISTAANARNELAYNRQASLGDVNLDGFLDIAIGADNVVNAFEGLPKSALLVYEPNDGRFDDGRFRDVGGSAVIPDFGGFYSDSRRDRAGPNLALRDVDNDGDLDLMQSSHVLLMANAPVTLPYSPAEYRHGLFCWRNLAADRGEFRFEKMTENGFASEARLRYDRRLQRLVPEGGAKAPALACLVFGDVNNDGLLDALAVGGGNRLNRPSSEDVGVRFWYNRGRFRFEEATAAAGLATLNRTYRQWQGFFEAPIPVPLDRVDFSGKRVRSQPGAAIRNPLDNRPNYSDAVFADFDNDGWLDLVVLDRTESRVIETRSFLYRNRGDGTFEPQPTTVSGLSGSGISGEAADLDNDGLVDLIIAADPDNTGKATDPRRYESMVFLNGGTDRGNHWLRLRFSGVSDAELIGTHVVVREPTGGRLVGMRGVYTNHTYKSSSPLETHFGLGDATRVDVEALLPGGARVVFHGVTADRFLDLNLVEKTVSEVRSEPTGPAAESLRKATSPAEAFTWLREESFSCGGQTHRVPIYRCNLFAEAMGLAEGETDVACEFVLAPGGRFVMGSSRAEQDTMARSRVNRHPIFNSSSKHYSRRREGPQHSVQVPAFLIARTEVTQRVWRGLASLAGLPRSPSYFRAAGDDAPVEQVSWHDATKWMQAVNQAHGLSLRLPTEAEWEYACRAGTSTPLYNGQMTIVGHCNSPEVDEIGWYMGNCGVDYPGGVDSARWAEKQYQHRRAGTQPVGLRRPNSFGLYDMIGNVMEWCEDHAHADYDAAPTDGSAWIGGSWVPGSRVNGPLSRGTTESGISDDSVVPGRVRRGGSWRQLAYNIRSAMRSFRGPSFSDSNQGFRVAANASVLLSAKSSGRTEPPHTRFLIQESEKP